jgi:hypothetical protein
MYSVMKRRKSRRSSTCEVEMRYAYSKKIRFAVPKGGLQGLRWEREREKKTGV